MSGRPTTPAEPAPSPEFLLAAACCRRPSGQARNAAVHDAAARVADWIGFLHVAERQRVVGLVHEAVSAAGIEPPAPVAASIAVRAAKIAQHSLLLASELARMQRAFDARRIPIIVLKGAPLAQLAYGSIAVKHSRDIDLLVAPEHAEAALQLVQREGYRPRSPADRLSAAGRRAFFRHYREIDFALGASDLRLEVKWRAVDNAQLLKGIDADSAVQTVPLPEGLCVRTLASDELFAYLCVHGAHHAWSRLKWLADLNALIGQTEACELGRLHAYAEKLGAGLCAGQALLLCRLLFGLELPQNLAAVLQQDRRTTRLVEMALQAMTKPQMKKNLRAALGSAYRQFLLGKGLAFVLAQGRIALIESRDVAALPLPAGLQFLYPLLRLPFSAWRRLRSTERAN